MFCGMSRVMHEIAMVAPGFEAQTKSSRVAIAPNSRRHRTCRPGPVGQRMQRA